MTSPDLIALIDHLAADAEAIETKLSRPGLVALTQRLKAAAEQPFFLEMILLGVNFAESKLGLAAEAPAANPAAPTA